MRFNRSDFPGGFHFGTATSAYQIEGHRYGGAGPTHWDSFAATPGNVVRAEDGARACDHYHRFEQDLDLVAGAGFDCYRFSTSWARVLPEGHGTPNEAGLDFYDRLTDALVSRGIKPCVTLYHWELPQALADQGGWRNADMPDWFADYTEVIMGRIGDRMYSAAPINEPWCVGWLSHFLGNHAPGLRDIRATARAMHHVMVSHGRAIQVMRDLGMGNLGAVFNLEWADPADDTPQAAAAAELYDAYYNRFFLDGVFKGTYPERVLEAFGPHLPDRWQDDFSTIQQDLDWVGLNYYTRKRIAPPNRELFAQGTGNVLAGLLGGLPITAVVVRTTANISAGAQSRLATVVHGVLLLLAVAFGAALLNRIPLAALAAVLILIGYRLTRPSLYLEQWRRGPAQFAPFATTLVAILLTDLLVGVLVGLAVGLAFVVFANFRRAFTLTQDGEYFILRLSKDVSFLNKAARNLLRNVMGNIPQKRA